MKTDLRDPITWINIYDVIRSDLGFDREADAVAASLLNMILSSAEYDAELLLTKINSLIKGSRVLVIGAYDTCRKCVSIADDYDVLIAADGALRCCISVNVIPDIIVTDLDGICCDSELINKLIRYRPIMVIHAHGDNIKLVSDLAPAFIRNGLQILGTCQVKPYGKLKVIGGFTDGDRAAYLSYFFKPLKIGLIGFNLGSVIGRYSKPGLRESAPAPPIKVRKLKWARILLTYLRTACGVEGIRWCEEGCDRGWV